VSILAVASLTAGFACALVAAAPDLWMLAAAALLLGAASGSVDAGLNTVVANGGPLRLLNAIHGAHGVGTVVGPILVTVAIVSVGSWRLPYAALVGAEVLCSLGWWTVRGASTPSGLEAHYKLEMHSQTVRYRIGQNRARRCRRALSGADDQLIP
jgi:MFS family permease